MDKALQLAIEEFKKADPETISLRSGTEVRTIGSQKRIEVDYLGDRCFVYFPEVEVIYQDSAKEVSPREKVLILHYLLQSKGTPLSGRLIDFRGVPGGITYYPVFISRVHRPFLTAFGDKPSLFLKAAQSIKGVQTDITGLSVKIQLFPRIPLIFVLYQGDDEFPPDCKVLFDASITDYLSSEDVVIACEETVKRLKRPDPVIRY